jgi:hypothetical protein
MNLRQLKQSLAKLPPDMGEMEVLISYFVKDIPDFDNLCFTGYLPIKGHECIVLGSLAAMKKLITDDKLETPEKGYKDEDQGSH